MFLFVFNTLGIINIDQQFSKSDTDKTVSIFNMKYKAVMKTVN